MHGLKASHSYCFKLLAKISQNWAHFHLGGLCLVKVSLELEPCLDCQEFGQAARKGELATGAFVSLL